MTTSASQAGTRERTNDDGGRLLRLALRLDAVASGAIGTLSLAAAPLLEDLLGAPRSLLWPTGAFLLVFAGWLWYLAARPQRSRAAVWTVIALNALWVLDSVVLAAAGWLPLTGWGTAVVLVQAAAVALFADLQLLGLRRSG